MSIVMNKKWLEEKDKLEKKIVSVRTSIVDNENMIEDLEERNLPITFGNLYSIYQMVSLSEEYNELRLDMIDSEEEYKRFLNGSSSITYE